MISELFGKSPCYGKNKMDFICGDVIDALKTLPDESVHCVITSPPYYRLRNYNDDRQIGLENTPGEFVDKLVAVFREVKRVLRADGTLWLNIGDSYAGSGKSGSTEEGRMRHRQFNKTETAARQVGPTKIGPIRPMAPGCKPSGMLKNKDLIGVPWMLAFALRDDGWYLRSDIIWKKNNYTPESVNDRPTKSYEHIFLFSKTKQYYYDINVTRRISGAQDRDIWSIGISAGGGHHAQYPTELPRKSIKISTSQYGCCELCMSPYKRNKQVWQKSCNCDSTGIIPPIVLDPFGGACTTALAAAELGRSAVMIDVKEEYLQIGQKRLKEAGFGKLLNSIVYI